jgi:hypothetical protein
MPAEVLDGNATTVAAPQVNAQEFGQAFAREFASAFKQSTTKEEKIDEINEVVAALKAGGRSDEEIQGFITTALGVEKKNSRILKEKIDETKGQFLQYQNEKELASAIRRITKSYSKDDDLISEVSGSIRDFVRSEFINSSNAEIAVARSKFYASGDLDEDIIEDLIAKKVERIHEKSSGKKGTAAPSVKPSDMASRPPQNGEDRNAVSSRDDMNEIERSVYDAYKSTMRHTLSPEDLEKHAVIAANQATKGIKR